MHKANPWGNIKCDKTECLVCSNPYNESFNCDKRNVTYKTFCLKCKENLSKKEEAEDATEDAGAVKEPLKTYYGETHCSARERGAQHDRDYKSKKEDSHMFKHLSECHNDDKIDDVRFGMSVIKQHFSSFSRQVQESVLIFLDPHVLNSKSMYNRCQVPRLSVMVGDQVANDLDQVRYDQVELDNELANMRNKHHLGTSERETRPNKRQKRWHVNRERNKKKKVEAEDDDEVSLSLKPIALTPSLPMSSSEIDSPPVVDEDRESNAKLFPIFNSNSKSNSIDQDETTNNKIEESPSLNSTGGAAKKKNKSKSNGGNNSIIKFLTPLRGKPPSKPNHSSDPS